MRVQETATATKNYEIEAQTDTSGFYEMEDFAPVNPSDNPSDNYVEVQAGPSSQISAEDLKKEIQNWLSEVRSPSKMPNEERQKLFFSLLQFEYQVLSCDNKLPIPQPILDQYFLFQTEMATAETSAEKQPLVKTALAEIQGQSVLLHAALSQPSLDEESKGRLEEFQSELRKAQDALDLAPNKEAVAQIEDRLTMMKDELKGTLTEILSKEMDSVGAESQHSGMRNYYKLKIAKKIAELRQQVNETDFNFVEIQRGIDEVELGISK